MRVIGVDFSGARDAGNAIWIASGTADGPHVRIETCTPASALPDGGAEKDRALAALVAFIADAGDAVIGLDFPFSLPAEMIPETRWEDFVGGFLARYPTPQAFRESCMKAANGKELKRRTDREARVPFSAYNLRLYRQTYEGIGRVLCPLVSEDRARVLPMQRRHPGKPSLAETCPASFLKREDLYPSYKGPGEPPREARRHIVSTLVRRKLIAPLPRRIRTTVIDNKGGDALDSVIAAACAARAGCDPDADTPRDALERIEARVFF